MTAARLFPPMKRTSAPMAKIATASPAAAVKRGFTPPVSACSRGMLHHPFGWEAGGEPHSRELLRGPRASNRPDRKSTRLNSSHVKISYAVFCLKKKKKKK